MSASTGPGKQIAGLLTNEEEKTRHKPRYFSGVSDVVNFGAHAQRGLQY